MRIEKTDATGLQPAGSSSICSSASLSARVSPQRVRNALSSLPSTISHGRHRRVWSHKGRCDRRRCGGGGFILVSHRTTPSHWLTLWRIAWSNSRQARLSRRRYRLLISSRSSREQPQSSVLVLGLVRRLGLVLILLRQLGLVLLRQLGLVLLPVLVLLRQLGRQLGVPLLDGRVEGLGLALDRAAASDPGGDGRRGGRPSAALALVAAPA